MGEFVELIVSHPYAIFVSIFSIVAAVGFLMFFWGWSGYLLAHGDMEHQGNARTQMVRGFSLFLSIAVLWEILRWLGSLFV